MTFSEFLNTTFVENEGVTEEGQWLPKHIAALQDGLRALLKLSGHSDVDISADGTAAYDYVLYKAANSNTWTVKKASEIKPSVDNRPSPNSQNPVSSGGVYVALQDVISAIDAIEQQLEDGVGARTLGELENVADDVDDDNNTDMVLAKESGESQWRRRALSSLFDMSGKFGYVTYENGAFNFFAEEGDATPIQRLQISGTFYNIAIALENGTLPIFTALTGDAHAYISFSAATTAGALGETPSAYPEGYTYVVSIDSGTGYLDKASGTLDEGGVATVDIRQFLATGTNRIRLTVTGDSSGQSKTTSLSCTLTDLTLSVVHTWQTPWLENQAYMLTGIQFSGNLQKTLHVKIGETELTRVFSPSENYTRTSLSYELASQYFPAEEESGVHEVEIWLSGGGVETQHITYNIACLLDGDTTPMVVVNNITQAAVNYNNDTLFEFAVVNADSILIQPVVSLDGTYSLQSLAVNVEEGVTYPYAPALEVEIVSDVTIGVMTATVTPYKNGAAGEAAQVQMAFDNSRAYNATAGAVFYLNAALRSNNEIDKNVIKNAARNASVQEYQATWQGFGWSTDGWTQDEYGHQALVVPARCQLEVADLKPLNVIGTGKTIEMMVRSANIADETTPILSFMTRVNNENRGFILYPTKVVVLDSNSSDETIRGVGLCENVITHLAVTIQKDYGEVNSGKNLVSIYVNGIPNVSFEFTAAASFGAGSLVVGQENTDFYLYMMRVYDFALEGQAVFVNFLNAIFDGDMISRGEYDRDAKRDENDILGATGIDYDTARRKGYNCMVIEPDDPTAALPDFYHKYKDSAMVCTMYFEYWGTHPDWNVKITNVPLDGQGTTSKKYMRWNLRGKLKKCDWFYGDSRGNYSDVATFEQTGKGYMDGGATGAAGHTKIERFTAKKNIASSPQGHKMGATALYDELFAALGLKEELPNEDLRVAVWQYPFLGFVKREGQYEFIGLYTAGPDKGCKVTFGYDENAMCIEGPNHNPRGTRFLHPWVDVWFDGGPDNEETLMFGNEEGWDGDFVGGLKTDVGGAVNDQILALYESEWKPAYDLVFHCSPYIASIAEMLSSNPGFSSMADVNNNLETFSNGSTTYLNEDGVSVTRKNSLMSFYDTNYDIWYYRNSTGQYEKLTAEDNDATNYNIKAYLGLTGSPTTSEILAARKAKFDDEWGNYFSKDQTFYHKCYCLLIGAKDNDAKNSYPQKHALLANGGKWGWKQDDLDSIFDVDNNGMATVKYSAEQADLKGGIEIFQGSDSAFWTIIWEWYQADLKAMMSRIATTMATMASAMGIRGNALHESVYNVLAHYFFEHSALYFPILAYQEDREYSYIEPWYLAGKTVDGITYDITYNNVYPLTQALGDRYQDERLWLERRIAYIFSKYSIGGFSAAADGYGTAAFTLGDAFTFQITPAIDLYPTANTGGSGLVVAGRTFAHHVAPLSMPRGGNTTNYINGTDWLYSLGDLSGMVLSGRGSNIIPFTVTSARMHDLKVGDANAADVLFNATSLSVSGPSFVEIDARNTVELLEGVDLSNCPRLQTVLFEGSTARGITLAAGNRIEELSYPQYQSTLFLHTMNFLTEENMTLSAATMATVENFYFYNCDHLNPVEILAGIMAQQGNVLECVGMTWNTPIEVSTAGLKALVALADGTDTTNPSQGSYHAAMYQNGTVVVDMNSTPVVQGTISVYALTPDQLASLNRAFPDLTVVYEKLYLAFEDHRVWEICAYNWGDVEDARGKVIASGELQGNGDVDVLDDFVFAPGLVIAARTEDGVSIPQKAARTVNYRLEIEVEGGSGTPWGMDTTGDNVFLKVTQHPSNTTTTTTTHISATPNNYASVLTQEGNKWVATFQATNAAQYLRVAIRAAAGVKLKWNLIPLATGNAAWQPVGITQAQCAAVSSLGNMFQYNPIISMFKELPLFTSAKVCPNFRGCSSLTEVNFSNITSLGMQYLNGTSLIMAVFHEGFTTHGNLNYYTSKLIELVDFPSTVTSIGENNFTSTSNCVIVCRATSVPTLGRNNGGAKALYVPAAAIADYKSATNWSAYANKIYPIEGSEYEH